MPQKPIKRSRPTYTGVQEEIFDEINRHAKDERPDAIVGEGPDGIKLRKPSLFLSDPPVVGDLEFQLMARELQRRVPYANVSKIVKGHTGGTIDRHVAGRMQPDDFGETNLLGLYDLRDKSVGIRPNMDKALDQSTLLHELAHSRGFTSENDATGMGAAFLRNPDDREKALLESLMLHAQKERKR